MLLPPLTPPEILGSMEVPDHPGVFFIGRGASRVTFQSQQRRALNLAWGLRELGMLGPGTHVAVVGAGLAGLTFAFAAIEQGARVTVVEGKRIPLYLQRGCQLRFIHPNIYEWPDPVSEHPLTELPCLNWGADYAARVCDTVLDQWRTREGQARTLYGYEVRGLRPGAGKTLLLAEGARNHREVYDLVVLAVGFGLERSTSGTQFLSYWENDNFGRALITPPIPRRYLVSGCGDGGLIDALRLSLNTFDHARFVRLLQYEPGLDKIREELLQIDRRVAAAATGPDPRAVAVRQGELLEQAYDALSIPDSLVKKIQAELREDTVVYLNDEKPSPFTLRSAILHRFGVYLLLKYGTLRFRAGRPVIEGDRGGPYRARFGTEGEIVVDEAVVRYGPVPAVARFLPASVVEAMAASPSAVAGRTREQHYGDDFLASDEMHEMKRKVRTQHALAMSALAFQNLYQPLKHDLFRVEANTDSWATDEAQYFVLRPRYQGDPTAELQLKSYEGIKIRYESAIGLPLPPVDSTPARPLVCGAGIENVGQAPLPAPAGQPRPVFPQGTIGCFVRMREKGQTALLTSSFAVGAPVAAKAGDRIVNPPRTDNPKDVIGELHSWVSVIPAGGADGNRTDGALVLLPDGTKWVAEFGPQHTQLPTLREPREVQPKDRVFKVGATSGITWGVVTDCSYSATITGKGESYLFTDVIRVRGDDQKPLMYPGDAGAVIVGEDGAVLGLLVGGSARVSIACPIRPVLDYLGCDLLLPSSPTSAAPPPPPSPVPAA